MCGSSLAERLSDRRQQMAADAHALQAGGRPFEPGTAHPHAAASEAGPRPSHGRTTCLGMVLWKRCGSAQGHESWAAGSLRHLSGVPPRPASHPLGPPLGHLSDAAVSRGRHPTQTAAPSGGLLLARVAIVRSQRGAVRRFGLGGARNVRRTCSSVEASSSDVASRVASPCSQRRVAARLSPVQHSSP